VPKRATASRTQELRDRPDPPRANRDRRQSHPGACLLEISHRALLYKLKDYGLGD
jgi:hypothetical protein